MNHPHPDYLVCELPVVVIVVGFAAAPCALGMSFSGIDMPKAQVLINRDYLFCQFRPNKLTRIKIKGISRFYMCCLF